MFANIALSLSATGNQKYSKSFLTECNTNLLPTKKKQKLQVQTLPTCIFKHLIILSFPYFDSNVLYFFIFVFVFIFKYSVLIWMFDVSKHSMTFEDLCLLSYWFYFAYISCGWLKFCHTLSLSQIWSLNRNLFRTEI